MSTLIIDYGMGNLLSVKSAFERCGADVLITDNPENLKDVDNFVLPGVGSFKDGMKNLKERGWIPAIKKAINEEELPLLGICLGMQLLADRGFEVEVTEGLGLIQGEVKKFNSTIKDEKIPHVGWNEIEIIKQDPLFEGVSNKVDFYFVHSYHFLPLYNQDILTETPYCGNFVSSIRRDNVWGVQFHPEKSQRPGLKLISNFLKL